MNRSQDRYISDYNNTLSMNRSMSNNAYINNTPNRSRRSPLQIQSNDLNNFNRSRQQRRNETEPWDKTKGPYGVRFDEMEAHMKMGQKRYKDDLEYLMSLKDGRHGDMTQKEWEEYNRKLHYMNDRYAYGELDRINFLRGVTKGYADEIAAHKEKLKEQKKLEDLEERKKFIDVNALEKAEKEKENEKKKILLRDQLNQLDLINQKKAYENQRDKDNDANMLRNNRDLWGKQYLSFKDNLSKKNDRILGNAEKFNNLLKNPYDPNIFKAKNDDEYNKLMAEAKLREKNKIDPTELEKVNKDFDDYNNGLKRLKEENKNRQKLYKQYLDNQTELDKLNRLKNEGDDMRPQLLMPAYYYPNLPEPVYHKARDSLLASKNQEDYFGKDMNKFFRSDAEQKTLLDYEGHNRYLGDSKLRHNPITCPVNDYYYNKYVNKLKKESEVIPAGSNNNYSRGSPQNNSRDNLINNGQQIFK
jgi:hypothetical protein